MTENNTAGVLPTVAVLLCTRTLDRATDPTVLPRRAEGFHLKIQELPCSSKADAAHLLRLLENGADGVLLIGCPAEACGQLIGSRRAAKRIDRVKSLLDQAGLGGDRVAFHQAVGLTGDRILDLAGETARKAAACGRHPLK